MLFFWGDLRENKNKICIFAHDNVLLKKIDAK